MNVMKVRFPYSVDVRVGISELRCRKLLVNAVNRIII